jgi:hypothetical protein
MSAPQAKYPPAALPPPTAASAWAPFRNRTFAVIWTATVVSNIVVQVANSLPMFLFAIPAGALADIVDRGSVTVARFKSFAEVANIANFWEWLGNAGIAINRSDLRRISASDPELF